MAMDGFRMRRGTALLAVGAWLKVNGEAIYGTRPWIIFGEGPTETAYGTFAESKAKPYTARDFRFTTRGDALYAIQLAEPENGRALITSIRPERAVRQVESFGRRCAGVIRADGSGFGADPARQPATAAGTCLSHRDCLSQRPPGALENCGRA